jgi:hypothetical protein
MICRRNNRAAAIDRPKPSIIERLVVLPPA